MGTRAGLFGNETGEFEAWVYPVKILRNFHVRFLIGGRTLEAANLARTLTVRPESTTITYAGDDFSVRETWFVPVNEPGAVITFTVQTAQPLEIEAAFEKDFQLEWPAALGGTYLSWDANLRAFAFGEETKKYVALAGSPSAEGYREEYFSNYGSSSENSLRLGVTNKGTDTKIIVIAASVNGHEDAQNTYQHLSRDWQVLYSQSAEFYRAYLARTIEIKIPDHQLQQAYDWSRVSMLQGVVTNPSLGTGLIAGYRTSGSSQRPGFAWFFGRDSLWTSLALDAEGDYATARTALDFISKFQRADGKIPHEISQTAALVPWFKDYPYGYASADATPLFIITMNDYVTRSGDVAFAKAQWEKVWKAYQFLRSTYDAQGLPQNLGIGHGWVEGGPLLPVKTELYQSGLGAEALRALGNLARIVGKDDVNRQMEQDFKTQQALVDKTFWSPDKKVYGFALDTAGHLVDIPSVLSTVPMWFGVLDQDKTELMIDKLADSDHQADWGMRIISSRDPKYNPAGYHFGSVWPLFTGWASVGEYRYHRAIPGYLNLRSNALLALDGSAGHVTEVLSGDYYQPLSTSSPHQIWSAAMVVSPMLRGMFGLEVDSPARRVSFRPHLPVEWTSSSIGNIRVGQDTIQLNYRKSVDEISLDVTKSGNEDCTFEFDPALSLRAKVVGVTVNGRTVAVHPVANAIDQHVPIEVHLQGQRTTIVLRVRDDFELGISSTMPPLGEPSQGLRITSQAWSANRDQLTVDMSGVSGHTYDLAVWDPSHVKSVEGGNFEAGTIRVTMPGGGKEYVHGQVVIHFASLRNSRH